MFNNHVIEEHRKAVRAIQTKPCSAAAKAKNSSLASQLPKHKTDVSRPLKKQVTFKSINEPVLDAVADDGIEEEGSDSNLDSDEESALQKLLDSMNSRKTARNNADDDVDDDNEDDSDDEDSEAELNSESSGDDSDTDNDMTASSSQHKTMPSKKKHNQVSAVDDKFFKLAEMEAFLDEQDLKEQQQHSNDAVDTEDDDDYDLSVDDKVIQTFCVETYQIAVL